MGEFTSATAVRARRPGAFDAVLDAQWSIGAKLHGGYLLAVLARAAAETAGERHPHVTAISGSFIAPPEPGPANIDLTVHRSGRTATHLRAVLSQDGLPCVDALITQSLLDEADPDWSATPPIDIAAEAECPRSPVEVPGSDLKLPLMECLELRIDPSMLGFAVGKPRHAGVIAGWQRLADGTDWDPRSVLVALDALPPVSYDLGIGGWVPTVQLSAYVRRLPAPGPVAVRMHANDLGGGWLDETAFAWDSKGRLVAQATQIAVVRTPNSR